MDTGFAVTRSGQPPAPPALEDRFSGAAAARGRRRCRHLCIPERSGGGSGGGGAAEPPRLHSLRRRRPRPPVGMGADATAAGARLCLCVLAAPLGVVPMGISFRCWRSGRLRGLRAVVVADHGLRPHYCHVAVDPSSATQRAKGTLLPLLLRYLVGATPPSTLPTPRSAPPAPKYVDI